MTGQQVDTAHSSGLSIHQYWWELFSRNEKRPTCTDEQLAEFMRLAFPTRKATYASFDHVRRARGRYNRGELGPKPRIKSQRYVYDADNKLRPANAHGTIVKKGKQR